MSIRNRIISRFPNKDCYFLSDNGCRFPSSRCVCILFCPYTFPKTSTLDQDIPKIGVVYARIQAKKARLISWIAIFISLILFAINFFK